MSEYFDYEGDPISYRFGDFSIQNWGGGPYVSIKPDGVGVGITHSISADPAEVQALIEGILDATGCDMLDPNDRNEFIVIKIEDDNE